MLEIDGAHGEGGGQLVRTAVALAAVTGQAMRISNIRAGRARPGLAAQHVAAVRAVAEICGARVDGLSLRARQIEFRPGRPSGGTFRFDIGTAGSATLVLQALVPAALAGERECRVAITGGTDVRGAPPLDYLQHVLLPLLAFAGAPVSLQVRRRGYFPRGGGELEIRVTPARLRPVQLEAPGALLGLHARAHVGNLPLHIARRMLAAAQTALPGGVRRDFQALEEENASGQGGAVVLWAKCEHSVLGAGRVAERGVRAESLGDAAGRELAADLAAGVALDAHAADQLLVFLALAGGESSFTTRALSSHACTAMWLIERFLPVRFETEMTGGHVRVRVRA